jgi:F420-dependent oxidoreductase-like protein
MTRRGEAEDMKLGLQLGYWGAQPPDGVGELVHAAEDAGFDAIFTAEAWGSDAFTPLAWWGRETTSLRLGTSIVQMSGRSPTSIAMHVLTLDHLSGGRVVLGMGVSGPQVVEGWYGQPFAKPLARTREVVGIVRQVLAREAPVTNEGPHYPLPYVGEGSVGLGKPLKPIVHPPARRRPDLARGRGTEERGDDRRDRRRVDPDLLHTEDGRHVPALAGRGLRPARGTSYS